MAELVRRDSQSSEGPEVVDTDEFVSEFIVVGNWLSLSMDFVRASILSSLRDTF